VELRVILKTERLLVFGFVLIKICLFFAYFVGRFLFRGLLFFKRYGTFPVLFTAKGNLGVFCENVLILGSFFRMCLIVSSFNFLADFIFC